MRVPQGTHARRRCEQAEGADPFRARRGRCAPSLTYPRRMCVQTYSPTRIARHLSCHIMGRSASAHSHRQRDTWPRRFGDPRALPGPWHPGVALWGYLSQREGSTPCRWHCLGAPGGPGTLPSCVSSAPQNPHKSGSARSFPTESPQAKRHSPAHDGTDANMPLPPLTGLYAGSAGLTILKLPVVRAATDLLLSGRSRVRVAVGAHVICAGQAICHQPVHRAHLASVPLACQIA